MPPVVELACLSYIVQTKNKLLEKLLESGKVNFTNITLLLNPLVGRSNIIGIATQYFYKL